MVQPTLPFVNPQHGLTPMMKQYIDIKSNHKDAILFYRMGDFYEMFFEDAKIASPILGIALTKRGQHLNDDIPMCGVPFHSSDTYIAKLIGNGHKVVICEQMETPEEAKKRGHKAVVKRDVVRIITAGTITEDNLLRSNSSNFLVAIANIKDELSIAWADISTGEFYTSLSSINSLNHDLARIEAKEILISDKLYQQEAIFNSLADFRRIVTIQANNLFDLNKAEHKIQKYYNILTSDALGTYSLVEIISCGALLEYVELTQKMSNLKISYPKKLNSSLFMSIDSATRRNLELTLSVNGEKKGSLLDLIDKTRTSCGARLLAQYISTPLIDIAVINSRLDLVEFFIHNIELTNEIITILSAIGDVERSISRLSFNRGGPRDLQVIKNSLHNANILVSNFLNFKGNISNFLNKQLENLSGFENLIFELENALKEESPLLARDGGFIKENYNAKLDQLQDLKQNSQQKLQELKQKYVNITGINSLKISYNNVLGYFIDINPQHSLKMKEELFIHRQTLANSVRYTTIELRDLEKDLLNLSDNILKIELELYNQLVNKIIEKSNELNLFAHSVAIIDVATSLAILALENNYSRPVIDNGYSFNIIEGRHPVIETVLKKQKQEFMANDCSLSETKNLWLLTGPNMAGKSTFLRQNALIAILGQIGSFVPAKSAKFGVIDKIFSRVGAADDLARGRSTFMVEMVETANILNNATNKSLIILDEIGRGTSTYDGVSIASACLSYIHDKIKARALFATHYHELTALASQLTQLICYTMQIKEWQDKVIFLHKVIPGIADKSYGIHVAELAGLPKGVTDKAKEILKTLEQSYTQVINIDARQTIEINPIIDWIKSIELENISAREALDILYKIKENI